MKTSHRSWRKNEYAAVDASKNSRASRALFTAVVARLSLWNSHFSTRLSFPEGRADLYGTKVLCCRTPSRSTRPIRKRQNLVAFQILLQNFRYPSTRLISMLISLPPEV
jgi:hypothetical protein